MKTEDLQKLFTIYRNEWQNAVHINPFYIFTDCSESEQIFEDVAELFLESTDYISTPEHYIRETEKAFLVVCFQYLFYMAPYDEMNFAMIIEMLIADKVDGKYNEDRKTDFQRLMEMNKEKETKDSRIVDKSYDLYQQSSRYIRQQALESLALRLCPLYSFQNSDVANFDESFLLQLSISLLHNCSSKPEEPLSLTDKKMLIAYAFSCLKFCFDNKIHCKEKIINFLNDNKQSPDFEIKSENLCENNQGVARYWKTRENKQISYEDIKRILDVKKFYDGCC